MKALFPKQTNFAVSNFLTKAKRLQERYLIYWQNLLLCKSIASIAVWNKLNQQSLLANFFVKLYEILNSCSVFFYNNQTSLLRVLHVVTHVKFSFCATILFKVWEGWVSSNNFYEDSKSGIGVRLLDYMFYNSIATLFSNVFS